MLRKLEVRTSKGELLVLPLDGSISDFNVQLIEGLEPVKATLVSSSFANMDGQQYHSSRREARNIKLQLGLDPDFTTATVRELRNRLYPFFMPKTEVTLTFQLFNQFAELLKQIQNVNIVGRVETFDSPLFTKDPVVDISLMCFDPDFIDPNPVIFSGMSTAGPDESVIEYEGSVETGVIFTFSPDRDISEFTIYHRPPDGTIRSLDFSNPLLAGDIVKISTVVGSKYAKRIRAGVESSLLYAVSPQSNWLELQPGDNLIRVYTTGAPIPFSFEYINRYGGL